MEGFNKNSSFADYVSFRPYTYPRTQRFLLSLWAAVIGELTESIKHIIQTEIHSILKGYKDQLEKVTSTVKMLQRHVSNLKRKNSVLQDKVKVYRQEFDSRCDESEEYSRRLCLRVKNILKSENEASEVALES